MTYSDAIAALYRLQRMSVRLGLDNINKFLDRLGRPEDRQPLIHVAGTNGKGSVVAFIASILNASGYRAGRTTSPHLADYRERICIDGHPVPKSLVTQFVHEHLEFIHNNGISFFESTIALAFSSFVKEQVDCGVVEVGMGGRLDATNAMRHPALTIITNVELDHTKSLGRTRSKIAAEKAGIIKPQIPILLGRCAPAVIDVIAGIARERNAPLFLADDVLHEESNRNRNLLPRFIESPLPGPHQLDNIRVAVAAAIIMYRRMGNSWKRITKDSLAHGIATAHWPGRFQLAPGNPPVYFDVAHNRAGSLALAATVRRLVLSNGTRPPVAVFACKAERSIDRVIRPLVPLVSQWFFCRLPEERGHEARESRATIRALKLDGKWIADPNHALATAKRAAGTRGSVLVFGSHFLVGDVIPKNLLNPTESQRETPKENVTLMELLGRI